MPSGIPEMKDNRTAYFQITNLKYQIANFKLQIILKNQTKTKMKTINKLTIVICMVISSIYMFGTGTARAQVTGIITASLQYSITTTNPVTVELHNTTDPWDIVPFGSVTTATMSGTTITAPFPATSSAGNLLCRS